jgi:(p)ppGpp synthase/HD superfamily hydrolase
MIALERAIALAAEAHAGQVDKAGEPYILHTLRVMLQQRSTPAMIVAVMHDVLEDCPGWTEQRLQGEGFTSDMIEALKAVTKLQGEGYDAFIRRAGSHPIGRSVKLADLRDNLDIRRLAVLTESDIPRLNKYKIALKQLETTP